MPEQVFTASDLETRNEYAEAIKAAAAMCEGDAALYAAFAQRDRAEASRLMPNAARRVELEDKAAVFDRDAQTCADLARRIRGLK